MPTQRRKRLDMIRLLLADLSSLRRFPTSHKFALADRALLNRTARESSARGLGLVPDIVEPLQANLWEWLTRHEGNEGIEYKL